MLRCNPLKITGDIGVDCFMPSGALQSIVKYYWIVKVKETTGDKKVAKISPTGFPELIFHFGDSVSINTCKGTLVDKQSESIIAGQITRPVIVDMNSHLNCLCVKLHPWGLSALFGIKSTEFLNQAVSLENVIPQAKRLIHEQLSCTSDDTEKIRIVEGYLHSMAKNKRVSVHPITAKVISSIRQGVEYQISELANDFHISNRTLQRRLNEDIGISPKMYSRIVRFNKAYHLIKNSQLKMQDICFNLGYYDLSHMINEFVEFSGVSPYQYFKNENPYNSLFVNQE